MPEFNLRLKMVLGSDVALGADRHFDITFGLLVVERSSFVSVLFREAFSHPTSPFLYSLFSFI